MGWVIQSPYSLKEWVRSFDDEYLGNSAGKEFACNAGDPGLIPGSGSSSGEGRGYPVQYSFFFFPYKSIFINYSGYILFHCINT